MGPQNLLFSRTHLQNGRDPESIGCGSWSSGCPPGQRRSLAAPNDLTLPTSIPWSGPNTCETGSRTVPMTGRFAPKDDRCPTGPLTSGPCTGESGSGRLEGHLHLDVIIGIQLPRPGRSDNTGRKRELSMYKAPNMIGVSKALSTTEMVIAFLLIPQESHGRTVPTRVL